MAVVIGALRETVANETRVAIVPEIATKLKALGARVLLGRGAGWNPIDRRRRRRSSASWQ
jgi:NAD/NADP transhydrogenase alpha subunit